MPESRNKGAGFDQKGGKKIEDSDVQPGEDGDEDKEEGEEEKRKEISRGGNEGSSTPTDTEGQTKHSGEENAVLPFKKRLHSLCGLRGGVKLEECCRKICNSLLHSHEETDHDELESKSRDSSDKKANQEEAQARAAVDKCGNDDDESSGESTEPPGFFLFEFQLTRSNRLLISAKEASDSFPPIGKDHRPTEVLDILQLTDDQYNEWNVTFKYHKEEDSFMITEGWDEFANWHRLEATDVIRFYKPFPHSSVSHYHVQFERINGKKLAKTPEFRRENFLFPLELTPSDIGYSRLFIPSKQVAIHFTDVRILPLSRDMVTMKFTDENTKDWYMDIVLYDSDYYMVIEGWVEFVKEHNLEAMNVIKFYKPVQPSHKKHFLIHCVREKVAGTSRTQPGSLKGKEGDRG